MKSSTVSTTKKLFQLSALTLSLALVGCGGGGGDHVDLLKPKPCLGSNCGTGGNGGDGGNGGNGGNGSGGEEVVESITISPISLYKPNGELTRNITGEGAVAKVKVTDENNEPVGSALITFSGSGVEFGTTNSAVLTNNEGEASIQVNPIDPSDTGSYSITAAATYEDLSATTNPYNFSIQAADIQITNFTADQMQLEAGQSTILTLTTKDLLTGEAQNNTTVKFSSTCGSFDNNSVVSSNQGNVSTTYSTIDKNGKLCEGKQIISALPANSNSGVQTIEILINEIAATSISYDSTNLQSLGTKASGSAETSEISFTVYSNNIPVANKKVDINLIEAPGDFSIITNGFRPQPTQSYTLTSDASGKVFITVYPGDIPGPVQLKATLQEDSSVFALSKNLAVASGRPVQNGITLGVDKSVLLRNSPDTASVGIKLVDRQGAPVPEGTTVSFVAEGGAVIPSNCSTNVSGECSVTFRSQNPRPANGRVSLLAYVEGDKQFIDMNGDNVYNAGDKLAHNIGVLYRDDNENKKYDPDNNEFLYKGNHEGTEICASALFSQPTVLNTCNQELDIILRHQRILGFASSTPTLLGRANIDPTLDQWDIIYIPEFKEDANGNPILDQNGEKIRNRYGRRLQFEMYGNELKTVPMPTGTELSVAVQDNSEGNGIECKADIVGGINPVDVSDFGRVYTDDAGVYHNTFINSPDVQYSIDVAGCSVDDKIELNVTSPGATYKERLEVYLPSDLNN